MGILNALQKYNDIDFIGQNIAKYDQFNIIIGGIYE